MKTRASYHQGDCRQLDSALLYCRYVAVGCRCVGVSCLGRDLRVVRLHLAAMLQPCCSYIAVCCRCVAASSLGRDSRVRRLCVAVMLQWVSAVLQ